ncbi:MAG: hypothetical protein Q9163_000793 [Psora crenata]
MASLNHTSPKIRNEDRAALCYLRACGVTPILCASKSVERSVDHPPFALYKQAAASRPIASGIVSTNGPLPGEKGKGKQAKCPLDKHTAATFSVSYLFEACPEHTYGILEWKPSAADAYQTSIYYRSIHKETKSLQQSPLDLAIQRTEKEYLRKFPAFGDADKPKPRAPIIDSSPAGPRHTNSARQVSGAAKAKQQNSEVRCEQQLGSEEELTLGPQSIIPDDNLKSPKILGKNNPLETGSIWIHKSWPPPAMDCISRRKPNASVKTRAWRKKEGKLYKMRKHLIAMVEEEQALYFEPAGLGEAKKGY